MNKRRKTYQKVVSINKKNIKDNKRTFTELSLLERKKRRSKSRELEIKEIEKSISQQKKLKKPKLNGMQKKNKKLEKLKRNPRKFFEDSNVLFFKYLKYFFKEVQ